MDRITGCVVGGAHETGTAEECCCTGGQIPELGEVENGVLEQFRGAEQGKRVQQVGGEGYAEPGRHHTHGPTVLELGDGRVEEAGEVHARQAQGGHQGQAQQPADRHADQPGHGRRVPADSRRRLRDHRPDEHARGRGHAANRHRSDQQRQGQHVPGLGKRLRQQRHPGTGRGAQAVRFVPEVHRHVRDVKAERWVRQAHFGNCERNEGQELWQR